ncbi:hypothetical protein AVEN_113606-1 [Araneus ventricosus]|uniref:Uncharacterized protein n=1 Tax=Araneus ventricosus TaxID=182803 RepID=A0A4Y2W5K2_ARAVE|nr:hypothetical protein AVEN_113606-1 [Araneus ventricosus]
MRKSNGLKRNFGAKSLPKHVRCWNKLREKTISASGKIKNWTNVSNRAEHRSKIGRSSTSTGHLHVAEVLVYANGSSCRGSRDMIHFNNHLNVHAIIEDLGISKNSSHTILTNDLRRILLYTKVCASPLVDEQNTEPQLARSYAGSLQMRTKTFYNMS